MTRVASAHRPVPLGFARLPEEEMLRPSREGDPALARRRAAFLLIPVGYPAAGAEVPELARKPLAEIAEFISPTRSTVDRSAAAAPERLGACRPRSGSSSL